MHHSFLTNSCFLYILSFGPIHLPRTLYNKNNKSLLFYYTSSFLIVSLHPQSVVVVLVNSRVLFYCIARILIRSIVEHAKNIILFIGYFSNSIVIAKWILLVFDSHKDYIYIFRFIKRNIHKTKLQLLIIINHVHLCLSQSITKWYLNVENVSLLQKRALLNPRSNHLTVAFFSFFRWSRTNQLVVAVRTTIQWKSNANFRQIRKCWTRLKNEHLFMRSDATIKWQKFDSV